MSCSRHPQAAITQAEAAAECSTPACALMHPACIWWQETQLPPCDCAPYDAAQPLATMDQSLLHRACSHHKCAASFVQVNGGSIADKVNYAYGLFEKSITVDSVFQTNEMIDTIAITKGKGYEGVVTRWGVTRLPRKTHRGLRKVSCAAKSAATAAAGTGTCI
jgi:hypothetical protein